jgi:hypothetical protein
MRNSEAEVAGVVFDLAEPMLMGSLDAPSLCVEVSADGASTSGKGGRVSEARSRCTAGASPDGPLTVAEAIGCSTAVRTGSITVVGSSTGALAAAAGVTGCGFVRFLPASKIAVPAIVNKTKSITNRASGASVSSRLVDGIAKGFEVGNTAEFLRGAGTGWSTRHVR